MRMMDDASYIAYRQKTAKPQDWPEDFAHGNGFYLCICAKCAAQFTGHKRRTVCRLCVTPTEPTR
jgi:hypothetical protein